MTVRTLIGAALISIALLVSTPSSAAVDKDCHEHPQLVGSCFAVHGRLSVYNGAPALRIWKIGTKRVLGISEQRFAMEGFRRMPEEIERAINQDVDLFGDFTVCPFTHPKPGEMQLVCVDQVKNLSVRKRKS